MEIRSMKISEVRPYPNNPRINKESVDKVAASIKEFGFRQPIVVDKNNVIIVGHTRLKAAKKLKLKEVPVMVAADLTDEQANAYRLADNKAAEFSMWDDELLAQELDGIFDIDMEQFGFDLTQDEEPEEDEVEEDEAPEEDEVEARCVPGDLWQLGEHRLLCGDSTDLKAIERLTGGTFVLFCSRIRHTA